MRRRSIFFYYQPAKRNLFLYSIPFMLVYLCTFLNPLKEYWFKLIGSPCKLVKGVQRVEFQRFQSNIYFVNNFTYSSEESFSQITLIKYVGAEKICEVLIYVCKRDFWRINLILCFGTCLYTWKWSILLEKKRKVYKGAFLNIHT